MSQELKIELDDQIFQQLKELCKGDKNKMQEYIKKALKIRINQEDPSYSHKDSLESYLNKGNTGSRNYGVKGQGW
jgi:mRNA-degrading endonuclease RelE of RelBE toxin-antitoxin system